MSRTFCTLCVFSIFAAPITALANTITVDTLVDEAATDNGNCTLREAILAANTDTAVDSCAAGSTGSDTINFAVAGFINLVDALPKVDEPLEIVGPGAAELKIAGNPFAWPLQGSNTAGIFLFEGASPLTSDVMPFKLKGLSLLTGQNLNLPQAGLGTGGCISVRNQSDLTLDHVRIQSCYSGYRGGAVHFEIFEAFTAIAKSRLTVLWSQIDNNQSSGFGGGVYVQSDADVAIRYSTINNNLGQSGGGGLAMKPASATGATLEIDHVTFSQNATTGFIGGAIALLDPGAANYPWTANIVNSTVVENTAHDGEPPLVNPPPPCSSEGAGIAVRDANLTINIENTIVTANVDKDFDRMNCDDTDVYIPVNVPATVTTGGTNWMGDVTYFGPVVFGQGTPNAQGDYVGVGPAQLTALVDNGGPTPTRSPASAVSNVVDKNGVCDSASGSPTTSVAMAPCLVVSPEFPATSARSSLAPQASSTTTRTVTLTTTTIVRCSPTVARRTSTATGWATSATTMLTVTAPRTRPTPTTTTMASSMWTSPPRVATPMTLTPTMMASSTGSTARWAPTATTSARALAATWN